MKLTSKNFNLVKIGTVLRKSPEYEDKRDYIVSSISEKFITVKFRVYPLNENKFKTKRINKKWFTDNDTVWITEWNIKDEEYEIYAKQDLGARERFLLLWGRKIESTN